MRVGIDRRLIYHFDWAVFVLTFAIALVGLLSVASASHSEHRPFQALMVRQIIWTVAGGTAMFAVVMFDYRALASYSYPIYAAVIGMLVAVSVIGQATGGSRRWINLGLFTLEPSELAKLALILVLVRYLREEPPPGGLRLRHIMVPALLLLVPAGLVLKQPDLGTMLTMVLIFATIMFGAGINLRTMGILSLGAVAGDASSVACAQALSEGARTDVH